MANKELILELKKSIEDYESGNYESHLFSESVPEEEASAANYFTHNESPHSLGESSRATFSNGVVHPTLEEDKTFKSISNQTPFDGSTSAQKASKPSALSKIVQLVNASDKSRKTIKDRLIKLEYSEQEIEEALARAEDYGFIDDVRYAKLLIESRLRQGRGSIGIEHELAQHNIDPSSIEGWPDAYCISYDSELERALSLLNKKPPRSKNLREGAYRKVVAKGFSSNVASSAARIWVESQRG